MTTELADAGKGMKMGDVTEEARAYTQKWRDDAFEAAAQIVEKYFGYDGTYCADDIRALKRNHASLISDLIEALRAQMDCTIQMAKRLDFSEREISDFTAQARRALILSHASGAGWRALNDVAAERKRQVGVEGWTAEHDDQHKRAEMATAAVCYIMGRTRFGGAYDPEDLWPLEWDRAWWKPSTYRRNLVKAAALVIAEIERLDRATPPEPTP